MANLGGTFDANNVAPSTAMDILPPGKYPVQIVNSEMKDTKTGGGQYLWLEMEITGGEHSGRKLWDRLNLVNSNSTAVEIAQRALSAICHAVGKLQVSDSEELHFKPMLATVKVKPAQGQYQASNEIGGYGPAAGAPVAMSRPAPAQTAARPAPAAAASTAAPPWRRAG